MCYFDINDECPNMLIWVWNVLRCLSMMTEIFIVLIIQWGYCCQKGVKCIIWLSMMTEVGYCDHNTACTCNNLCQINANNYYPNHNQIIFRHISLELFPEIPVSVWIISGIHVSIWNYFQTYMCLSGIISRHTLQQCLEIFWDIICQCLELFPAYMSVSGILSRHIC